MRAGPPACSPSPLASALAARRSAIATRSRPPCHVAQRLHLGTSVSSCSRPGVGAPPVTADVTEPVVHAKGGGAHGFLAVTEDVTTQGVRALGVRVANGFGHSALALTAMTES